MNDNYPLHTLIAAGLIAFAIMSLVPSIDRQIDEQAVSGCTQTER